MSINKNPFVVVVVAPTYFPGIPYSLHPIWFSLFLALPRSCSIFSYPALLYATRTKLCLLLLEKSVYSDEAYLFALVGLLLSFTDCGKTLGLEAPSLEEEEAVARGGGTGGGRVGGTRNQPRDTVPHWHVVLLRFQVRDRQTDVEQIPSSTSWPTSCLGPVFYLFVFFDTEGVDLRRAVLLCVVHEHRFRLCSRQESRTWKICVMPVKSGLFYYAIVG